MKVKNQNYSNSFFKFFSSIYNFLNQDISISKMKKFNDFDLALLLSEMSLMTKGGIDIISIIDINISESKSWKKEIFKGIKNDLINGKSLSNSFKNSGAFPQLTIGMLKVAESSGTLEITLKKLSQYYFDQGKLKKKIFNALSYPFLLIISCIIVVLLIFHYVIPIFLEIFSQSNASLPLSTRILFYLANHFSLFGPLYFSGFVTIVLIVIFFRQSIRGRVFQDKCLIKLPIIGKMIKSNFELFFISAMAIQSKTNVDILSIVRNSKALTKNTYFLLKIIGTEQKLMKGNSLYEAFSKEKLLSEKTLRLIKIGEDSSKLGEVLEICSKSLQESYLDKIEKINIFIEPLFILIMSTIVGFIVFSLAIPMFDMVNQF